MNIALIAQSGVFSPLQNLMRLWTINRSQRQRKTLKNQLSDCHSAPESIAVSALSTGATARIGTVQKPLRVVRVVEAGQARASSGRMVISGRMADVCAELDRLAAREAMQS